MKRWEGRVAIVTGASSGIGAAIAEELVKNGMKVVGLARRVEKVQELATKLKAAKAKGELHGVKCDVTKKGDIACAFSWVKDNLGGVDVLVNNAGADSANTLFDGPVENWRTMFELNVLALSACTKEAIACMKKREVDDGHIVHINSTLGHSQPPAGFGFGMYAATKHAVTALTESLRRELVKAGSKIKVTSVSPGVVKTEFLVASGTDIITPDAMYSNYAHLLPKDIADAVVYCVGTPPHVQVQEMMIRPVGEQM